MWYVLSYDFPAKIKTTQIDGDSLSLAIKEKYIIGANGVYIFQIWNSIKVAAEMVETCACVGDYKFVQKSISNPIITITSNVALQK